MRYLKHAIVVSCLPVMLFFSLPLVAEQSILINPENPPEVITVQTDSDFNLTLEGKGWYLNRYDRTLLSFKLRRIEPASTTFVMHSLDMGTAQLVLSMKQLDIPLIVVIVHGEERTEGGVSISKDQEPTETMSREPEKTPSVSDKAEALRERGLVKERSIEDQTIEDEAAALKDDTQGKVEAEEVMPEQKAATPSKRVEEAVQTKPDGDVLYYVDEDNRIVKVPRVHEEDFYRRGRRYFQKGEYGKARQELQLYLSKCEKCTKRDSTRLLLADISLQIEDEEGALVQLGEVVESGGEEAVLSALKIRAHLHDSAGRFEFALADYEEIYRRGGGSNELVLILGDVNYALHDEEEALRWYEVGIARGVATDETIYRVATLYDRPGGARDIEKAYEYYRLITEEYRSSDYYQAALQRVQFFESHFFDYY